MRAVLGTLLALALAGCVDSTYRCGTAADEYACTDGLACDPVSGTCLPCKIADREFACGTGLVCSDTSDLVNGCQHTGVFRCTTTALTRPDGGACPF